MATQQQSKRVMLPKKNQPPSLLQDAPPESVEPTNGESKAYTVSEWFDYVHLLQDKWAAIDHIQHNEDNKGVGRRLLLFFYKGIQKILCKVAQVLWKV